MNIDELKEYLKLNEYAEGYLTVEQSGEIFINKHCLFFFKDNTTLYCYFFDHDSMLHNDFIIKVPSLSSYNEILLKYFNGDVKNIKERSSWNISTLRIQDFQIINKKDGKQLLLF